MRPGQQHNRRNNNRGRNNGQHGGHRNKQQNPLARSYESNGPDVKVRGTPAHIAEKYMALARDAQSAGDPVLAENYLQHAEHYNRIIMAYREQFQQENGGQPQPQRFRQPGFDPNDGGDDLGDDQPPVDTTAGAADEGFAAAAASGTGEQPATEPRAFERQPHDRGDRPDRFNRFEGEQRHNERGDRQERFDRQGGGQPYRDRDNRGYDNQGGDRQFRRDRFDNRGDRNRQHGGDQRRNNDFRDDRRFDNRGEQGDRGGQDRGYRQGQERHGGDRGFNDRGFNRNGNDRQGGFQGERGGDRGFQGERQDRQGEPRAPETGGAHERYVPERRPPRQAPAVQDQPMADWQPSPAAERVERVERSADTMPPPAEPVVTPVAAHAAEAPAESAPAPRGRRKTAAAAAPAGDRFQEQTQPSFLRRSTRKPKAEGKPADDGDGGAAE